MSYLSVWAAVPMPLSPFSLPSAISAIFSIEWAKGAIGHGPVSTAVGFILGAVPFAVLFVAWSFQLLRGKSRVPVRSAVLLALLALASVWHLVATWHAGVENQGYLHTALMGAVNAFAAIGLALLLRSAVTVPSFARSLAFHGLMFAWVAWCAFPWLGELI